MRSRLALFNLLIVAALALPVLAHDVKDPVCRMTVDSDTAKFTYKLGNKTFYFCSKACRDKFAAEPEKYEKLAGILERQDLHEYSVELKAAGEPVAGRPVSLEIAVRYADSKELVKDFELVHERLLHLIMTTEDMSWFEHQHPVRGEDGIFRLNWIFPRAGKYRLFADFTPADGDNQVKPLFLTVGGSGARTLPLTPDRKLVKQIGDLRFALKLTPALPLRMESPALLTYTIRDRSGRPVRDIQPYIGAMGHLLAINQDGKQVVHTHVVQSATQASMTGEKETLRVTAAMVSETGPVFTFKLTLPTGGLYKTWAQFMRGGRVYTVPFAFDVEELWAKSGVTTDGRVQRAAIVIDSGFQPTRVTVRAGKPVELTLRRKETTGCGGEVMFPTLAVRRTLKPGESVTVRFTPEKPGTIPFTCGMKMYRGEVVVK